MSINRGASVDLERMFRRLQSKIEASMLERLDARLANIIRGGLVRGDRVSGSPIHVLWSSTHSDVDAADTPVDGDVPTWNAAASKWIAQQPPGGAGAGYATIQDEGAALQQRTTLNVVGPNVQASDDADNSKTVLRVVRNRIDLPKGSADSPDDEFDGGTLDAKWTLVSGSAGTVDLLRTSQDPIYDLSTRPGWLLVQVGRTTANQRFQLRQDYVLPDGASIVVALAPTLLLDANVTANNELWSGIALNSSDSGFDGGTWQGLFVDADLSGWRWLHYDGTNTIGAFPGAQSPVIGKVCYLRLLRSSLTYYGFLSFDGVTWLPMGSKTVTAAYDNIWIFCATFAGFGTPIPIQAIDWIRQGGSGIDPW